jgi:phage shock protein A
MDRMLRVVRANVNSLITTAEDPEKVLEKAVVEMQENLLQMRQAVASAIATQKRTERQAAQAESTAQEWYRRAQLALQQNNEALTKRHTYQETATALSQQRLQQAEIVDKLKKDMRTLELKIGEAKTKKDMYIARARSAEASVKLQEMLGGISSSSSLNAFERMEEKVIRLEAQSEVISLTSSNDLEKRFAVLESSDEIDTELAAMKEYLNAQENNPNPPTTTENKPLVNGQS